MKLRSAAAAAMAALVLAGCGSSPPTRFYELTATPPAARPQGAAGAPVAVAAVHLPEDLDRLEVVSGMGPNRLSVSNRDRWAAPLDDMSRRVLAEDLAERLPAGMAVSPRSPRPKGARLVVVDVQTFRAEGGGQVVLQASWSLVGPDRRPLIARDVRLTDEAGGGPGSGGQAAAMSRLLGQLADRIAGAVLAQGRGDAGAAYRSQQSQRMP